MDTPFCAKCGRETQELSEGGLCEQCQPPRRRHVPQVIRVAQCPHCGYFKLQGKWQEIESFSQLLSLLLSRYFTDDYYAVFDDNPDQQTIAVTAYYADDSVEITIRIQSQPCNWCSRRHGGYYTTVIQLRTDTEVKSCEQPYRELMSYLKGNATRKRFVSHTQQHKNGYDIYVSSLQYAQQTLAAFARQYPIERKQSKSLLSHKEGKPIYRHTISVRLQP